MLLDAASLVGCEEEEAARTKELLALPAGAAAAAAAAGEGPVEWRQGEQDGSLSLEEYKSGMKDRQLENAEKRFKRIDTNSDGKLSFEEFKAGMPKPKE